MDSCILLRTGIILLFGEPVQINCDNETADKEGQRMKLDRYVSYNGQIKKKKKKRHRL